MVDHLLMPYYKVPTPVHLVKYLHISHNSNIDGYYCSLIMNTHNTDFDTILNTHNGLNYDITAIV